MQKTFARMLPGVEGFSYKVKVDILGLFSVSGMYWWFCSKIQGDKCR